MALVGASADMDGVIVRSTLSSAVGKFGDGIAVESYFTVPTATLNLSAR